MYVYTYENLKKAIDTENGKKIVQATKNVYEKLFKDKPIPVTNYSYYKLIYKDGNRDKHQAIYYERRRRFALLQILALADDAYIDELEQSINSLLEEYTWVLPAHNLQKDQTFDYTVIDLFSSETGFYLSETLYVMKDKLSPDIKNRIYRELKSRIVDNYESRTQLWDTLQNNWAAVCGCGVGITYMYIFPERFNLVKHRLLATMECYLSGTKEEGTTPEGVGYWVYGFGFFAHFFEIYTQFTETYPEILSREKVKNSLKYITNACLGGNSYLPFADGGSRYTKIHAPVSYTCKNLFGDDYVLPEYVIDDKFIESMVANTSKANSYRMIYGVDEFGLGDKREPRQETIYYAQSEIFIHKDKKYAFAAKCGHNLEMHNHNDVASFQIVVDGKGVIVDPGPPNYTWQYFNGSPEYRYGEEVYLAGSMGHSVPIVNGKYQKEGAKANGTILEHTETNFKFDFAKAYGEGVESLIVNYQMHKDGVAVAYDCKGIDESITFHFLSFDEPKVNADGSVIVDKIKIKSTSGLTADVKRIEKDGHGAKKYVLYAIDYKVEGKKDVKEQFEFIV